MDLRAGLSPLVTFPVMSFLLSDLPLSSALSLGRGNHKEPYPGSREDVVPQEYHISLHILQQAGQDKDSCSDGVRCHFVCFCVSFQLDNTGTLEPLGRMSDSQFDFQEGTPAKMCLCDGMSKSSNSCHIFFLGFHTTALLLLYNYDCSCSHSA